VIWTVISASEQIKDNPAKTFLLKERINAKLFIDRTALLYKGETQIQTLRVLS